MQENKMNHVIIFRWVWWHKNYSFEQWLPSSRRIKQSSALNMVTVA